MKSFVFDKVSERMLKLTTIGPQAKDNAGPMVSCYFLFSPLRYRDRLVKI